MNNKMQKNINEKSRMWFALLNLEVLKLNKKMKIYLLIIGVLIILSVGLVFVESQCGPAGCSTFSGNAGSEGGKLLYWDETGQKLTFEKIDPLIEVARQKATATNMMQDKHFMEENWNSIKESEKEKYIIETYANLKLNNNPGNFRLNADGSLTLNGEVVLEPGQMQHLNMKNAEITFGVDKLSSKIGEGSLTWTIAEGLQYKVPQTQLHPDAPRAYPPGHPAAAPAQAFGAGGTQGGGQEWQQALQLIQQIAGLFKELKSNGQGQTTATQNSQGGTKATLEREAALALEDGKGNPKLLASQKDTSKKAEVDVSSEKKVDITNANIIVPEQIAARVDDKTTLVLNGIDGDDPNNPPKTDEDSETKIFKGTIITLTSQPQTTTATILSLSKLLKSTKIFKTIPQTTTSITAYFITTEAIKETTSGNQNKITGEAVGLGGQSIELLNHDVEINGHDIDSYALKTFNKLEAGGQNLKFYSGESLVEFNNQQTLFNRLPKKIPYGVKKITNKLDQNNKFILKHYTNRLGELTEAEDENKIISVGDITTKHPTKSLIIAKVRKEMWPRN